MNEDVYIITDGKNNYWNNDSGWVNLSEAAEFSEDEFMTLDLPIEGYWIARHNANFEQYYLEKLQNIKRIVNYVIDETTPVGFRTAIIEIDKLVKDIPK
jgi:hypothetical protein